MASSNFLVWDPPLINAETDPSYLADTTRSGGALTNAILPSPLFNKFAYQVSTFVAAFSTMLVNKGYSPLDSNFANLVAVLTNVKTSADFSASIVTVPWASSIAFDASTSSGFDLTLTGNVVTSSLINTTPGQLLTFIFAQDSTGSRTFSWPTNLYPANPFVAICPQPNSISVQQFMVRVGGTIVPTTPLLWLTSSGLLLPPSAASVQLVTTSGNVSNQFSEITEQVNSTSGPIVRTLYTAIGYAGFKVNGKNLGNILNTVTYVTTGGQTIDGFPNYQVNPYNSITFQSNGANWIII